MLKIAKINNICNFSFCVLRIATVFLEKLRKIEKKYTTSSIYSKISIYNTNFNTYNKTGNM